MSEAQPSAAVNPDTAKAAGFSKIFVAVHGIGDQSRNATVRSVATRLARSMALTRGAAVIPLAPQPLGFFHGKLGAIFPLDDPPDVPLSGGLEKIGFSEIFWADVPKRVADDKDTLEETKAWARTVVARARNRFEDAERRHLGAKPADARDGHARAPELVQPDFSLAAEVVDEIIETVYVLENLTFLAEKAGLFTFDLREVLEDYLGDVQLVTEFAQFRSEIIGRFHAALEEIEKVAGDAEIYIVAHSEGTVVSFLGLLLAMAGIHARPGASENDEARLEKQDRPPAWLRQVRGYMTLGSPIDKHLLLWPQLWKKVRLDDGREASLDFTRSGLSDGAIRWRNYYDYGDPVGFRLDTARDWLEGSKCKAFEFCDCPRCQHDLGFARYILPGKAHNDYWGDPDVFEHFIRDVVQDGAAQDQPANKWQAMCRAARRALHLSEPRNDAPFRPRTNGFVYLISPLLPYVLSFVLIVLAAFILFKSVTGYTHPSLDPVQKFVWHQTVGKLPPEPVSGLPLLWHALSIGVLVSGVTLMARLPRLAVGKRWWWFGALAFFLGCAAWVGGVHATSRGSVGSFYYSLPKPIQAFAHDRLEPWIDRWLGNRLDPEGPTFAIMTLAAAVALFALYAALRIRRKERKQGHQSQAAGKERKPPKSRRQRWLFRGMRPLIAAGAAAITLIVWQRLADRDGWVPPDVEIPAAVAKVVAVSPPIWPVLLGGAAFLYLWWLAALIFDLGFVWHRYIRNAIAVGRLKSWSDLPAHDPNKCRNWRHRNGARKE